MKINVKNVLYIDLFYIFVVRKRGCGKPLQTGPFTEGKAEYKHRPYEAKTAYLPK